MISTRREIEWHKVYDRASALMEEGQYCMARNHFKIAERMAIEDDYKEGIIYSLFGQASLNLKMGLLLNALKVLEHAKESATHIEYPNLEDALLAKINLRIGLVYLDMDYLSEAEEYFNKATELFRKEDDELERCMNLISVGLLRINVHILKTIEILRDIDKGRQFFYDLPLSHHLHDRFYSGIRFICTILENEDYTLEINEKTNAFKYIYNKKNSLVKLRLDEALTKRECDINSIRNLENNQAITDGTNYGGHTFMSHSHNYDTDGFCLSVAKL